MSAISAATIKYGEPYVTKQGGLLFTITNIEIPATEEEYAEGGIELKPESLGLTVGLIGESGSVGGTASTTALAAAIWSDPFLVKAKESGESGKQVAEAMPCAVTIVKGKALLRTFNPKETNKTGEPFVENKTATKVKLGLFQTTIYAFGK